MPPTAAEPSLAPWHFDPFACRDDLAAFEVLLASREEVGEREDILPFFRAHPQLAAFLGSYHPNLITLDRLGSEVPLFGFRTLRLLHMAHSHGTLQQARQPESVRGATVALPALDHDMLVADERAAPAVRDLYRFLAAGSALPLRLVTASGQALEVPAPVDRALRTVVEALAAGDAVTVVPLHQQLTTSQAARLLGVSRPTLIGLLDRGEVPYSLAGTHRRLRLADVLAYRARRAAEASAHLDAILSEVQEDGGYF